MAAVLTTCAITNFHPDLIINSGSAGGIIYKEKEPLKIGDVIIGSGALNVDSFWTMDINLFASSLAILLDKS